MNNLKAIQHLLENAPFSVVMRETKSHILTYYNKKAAEVRPNIKNELGKALFETHPEKKKSLSPILNKVFKTQENYVLKDLQVQFKSERDGEEGTHYFDVVYTPIKIDDGKIIGVMAVGFDVTERHNSQLLIGNQKENLEKIIKQRTFELIEMLNKEKRLNEEKSNFVSFASHEFRTPLATILTSISLIEEHVNNGNIEKAIKHINRIKRTVGNTVELLNDFLALDQISNGHTNIIYENINLFEIVEVILKDIKHQLKEGQKFNYSYTGKKEVTTDKKIVRNIILNLLTNAIKYSSEGKPIHISINSDENTSITIKDEGIGIPDDEQEKVFQRFFRANNVTSIQGTGLGLNIVKMYVELLDGEISFTSKSQKGTTFQIILPKK